jgi:beta-lactamase regulating signal transducer with metallopeptidase domain
LPGESGASPQPASPSVPLLQRVAQALTPALPWVALAWMGGVMALSCWHLLGWAGTRRIAKLSAVPDLPGVVETLARLAETLCVRRPVKALQSALVKVPAVVGWLKPVILLPAGMATGLSAWQLEMILVHELEHVRRCDYLVNLLQSVVETLLFYHPAAWYVSRCIRAERENCCDDAAIGLCGDPPAYAEALVAVAAEARLPRRAVAANGADLLPRIRRILGIPCHRTARSGAQALIYFALVGTLLAGPLIGALAIRTTTNPANAVPTELPRGGPSTRPADDRKGIYPLRQMYPNQVDVDDSGLTFQGAHTTWEQLPKLLEQVPDRPGASLGFVIHDSQGVKELCDIQLRAAELGRSMGFKSTGFSSMMSPGKDSYFQALMGFQRAIRARLPSNWGLGYTSTWKPTVWNWDPPEGYGALLEFTVVNPRPIRGPLQVFLWIMEPDYIGKPAAGATQPFGMPRELGTWRGRRVIVLHDGSNAGWSDCDADIRAALSETDSPKGAVPGATSANAPPPGVGSGN